MRCVSLGCHVTLMSRSLSKEFNIAPIRKQVQIKLFDMSKWDKAKSALPTMLPEQDVIFHMAAQTSHIESMGEPIKDLYTNCGGTLALLEACRVFAPDATVVMPGTVTQVGRVVSLPVSEELADWPLSLYDTHKLTCEKYLHVYYENYGLKTTTLRLANVFGERQQLNNPHRGVLNLMLKRAMTGQPITIYEPGDFIRDYSYVQNVVDALLLAAISEQTAGESYVFGSGIGMKFFEMIEQLADEVNSLLGVETEIRWVPFPTSEKKIDAGDFIADNHKFSEHTGWFPNLSFAEGLQNTIQFYQEHLGDYDIE